MTVEATAGLETFVRERRSKKPALLMAHAVVGYPSFDANWEMLKAMNETSVDLVELQLPFSEPIADGPWFVKANQEAIQTGVHWNDYFDLLKRAAAAFSFPLLFMGYYNSIFRMGALPPRGKLPSDIQSLGQPNQRFHGIAAGHVPKRCEDIFWHDRLDPGPTYPGERISEGLGRYAASFPFEVANGY